MSQRNPGGLVSGTAINVTTFGASGIFTLSQVQQFISAGRWPQNFFTVIETITGAGTWVCPTGVTTVDYLVVAGGGGGN